MKESKLIIIEGIPGSGKTTAAWRVKEFLEERGIKCRLYQEGDLNHPADFESVACFNKSEFYDIVNKYPEYKELLIKSAVYKNDDIFLPYRKLQSEGVISQEISNYAAKYDICDGLDANRYMELTKDRWREFSDSTKDNEEVIILECCFLQNPSVILLGKHNLESNVIIEHILYNEDTIKNLKPVIVYLYQESVKETIERVAKDRPKEWLDFVTCYVTENGYGKAEKLIGFEGMITFFEVRRALELEIFKSLTIDKILIDNSDYNYETAFNKMLNYIEDKVTPCL